MTRPPSPPPDEYRCTAKAKGSGERCKGWSVRGIDKCAVHGPGKIRNGVIPPQRQAIMRRAAIMDAHEQAERMAARAGVDADPIEHLLDSLHRMAALVEVYGMMVAGLDQQAQAETEAAGRIRGELGAELVVDDVVDDVDEDEAPRRRAVSRSHDRLMGLDRHGAAMLHPFVVEYHRLIDQRAKLAKLALDAGVAERQVRLAEGQGRVIVEVVRRSLTALGVEVTEEVTKVIAGELRAVATSA